VPPKRRPPQRGGPRNTRPAQRAGAARGRPAAAPAPRPRFTNRATILLVVLAILVISYASSMRAYLHQRSQILDAKAQIARDRGRISALEAEKRRWSDPAYVEQQARERFGWVMPGEKAYQVLDANGDPLTGTDQLTDPSTIAQPHKAAWWAKVRESVDAVDHPKKLVKPTPATHLTPKTPGSG
jgi:cell division protein FtsB